MRIYFDYPKNVDSIAPLMLTRILCLLFYALMFLALTLCPCALCPRLRATPCTSPSPRSLR